MLGVALVRGSRWREAIAVLDSASVMSAQNPWATVQLVIALSRSGDSTRARTVFNEMTARVRAGRVNSMFVGSAASWAAGPDEAFRWLERERSERTADLSWPYASNQYAPATIRDPRFAEFWARLKVVPPPGL